LTHQRIIVRRRLRIKKERIGPHFVGTNNQQCEGRDPYA